MIFCPGSQCLIPFENLYMNTVGVIQLRIWILFGSGGIFAQKGIFFRENWLLYRESGRERVLYHWPGQSIDIQPQLSGDLIVWFTCCWWWCKLGRYEFRSSTWIFLASAQIVLVTKRNTLDYMALKANTSDYMVLKAHHCTSHVEDSLGEKH